MTRSDLVNRTLLGLSLTLLAGLPAAFAEHLSSYERGLAEMSHRDYEGAINSFSEAIGFDMTNADAYFKRGQSYYYQKNYQSALSDFDYLLKMRPRDTQAMLWAGTAHARLGHETVAVDLYLQAMRNDPKLVTQFQQGNGGETKSVNPKNEGAVNAYEKAVQLYLADHKSAPIVDSAQAKFAPIKTNDLKSDIGRSGVEKDSSLNEPEMRLEQIDAAILADPTNALLFFRRANANKRLGNMDKALADFSEAIRLDPMKPRFYLARARLYHEQNQPDLSRADVKKARSVDPTILRHTDFNDSKSQQK